MRFLFEAQNAAILHSPPETFFVYETLFLPGPKNSSTIPEFPISSDRDPKIPNPPDERGPEGLQNGPQVPPRTPRKPLVKQRFATWGFAMLKTL